MLHRKIRWLVALGSFSAHFHMIFDDFVNFLNIATISLMNYHSFTGIALKTFYKFIKHISDRERSEMMSNASITSKNFEIICSIFQSTENWCKLFRTNICFQICIKHILPRLAMNWTRLEFDKIDMVFLEYFQRFI